MSTQSMDEWIAAVAALLDMAKLDPEVRERLVTLFEQGYGQRGAAFEIRMWMALA